MNFLNKLIYVKGSGKAFVLIYSLYACIIFIVNFYFFDSFANPTVPKIIVYSFTYILIPIVFLFPVIWISEKVFLFKRPLNLIIHIFLSLIYVFAFVSSFQAIRLAIDGYLIFNESVETIVSLLRRQLLISGSMSFLLYWGIVVLSGLQKFYYDLDVAKNLSNKLEAQLSNATLSTLKAQLKPHFLFNTLNMVDFLIHTDPKKAVGTIDKLEHLIQSTFDKNQPNSCTIEAEMIFLKKYLDIEKDRFQERLILEFEVSREVGKIEIPCYLVQPLVENAIKHGVGKSLNQCIIQIKALFKGEFLVIEVNDNAHGFVQTGKKNVEKGIGLRNIEERIKIYFGEEAFLDVGSVKDGMFKSAIVIPKKYLKS